MAALFANGRIVEAILLLVLLEAAALLVWHRRTGRGLPPGELLPALLAGAGLLAAWRLAIAGAAWPWLGLALLAALLAHLADLARRWR
jgi:hypothetical protein